MTSEVLDHRSRPVLRFWAWMACLFVAMLIGLAICGLMKPAPRTMATQALPVILESGLRGLPIWYHIWIGGTVALIAHLHFRMLWQRLAATFAGIAALYALVGLTLLVGPVLGILQRCADAAAGTCNAIQSVLLDMVGKLAVAWTLEVVVPLAVFTIAAYAWLGLGLRLAERLKGWLDSRARID